MPLSSGRALRPRLIPIDVFPDLPPLARPARAVLAAALVWLALCVPAPAAPPQDPLGSAKKLFDAGQAAQAAAVLAEAVKREPADERFWALLGRAKAMLNDRAGALEALRMALRLNPADTLTRMRLDMLGDLAPGPAPAHGRAEPPAKAARPPSALERAALDELGRASADPGHVGCGAAARPVLDPLVPIGADPSVPMPPQSARDDSLELAGLVAARLDPGGAALTRHGPYSVRLAERAALTAIAGGSAYLVLAVTSEPGPAASVEALAPGPNAPLGAPDATAATAARNAARLAALAGLGDPAGAAGPVRAAAIAPLGQIGAAVAKPAAIERLDARIRREALDREAFALAGRIVARCREDGLAQAADKSGPFSGDAALLAAIDRPAVLLAINIPPGPAQARREVLEKLAASLARSLNEEDGRCP